MLHCAAAIVLETGVPDFSNCDRAESRSSDDFTISNCVGCLLAGHCHVAPIGSPLRHGEWGIYFSWRRNELYQSTSSCAVNKPALISAS